MPAVIQVDQTSESSFISMVEVGKDKALHYGFDSRVSAESWGGRMARKIQRQREAIDSKSALKTYYDS